MINNPSFDIYGQKALELVGQGENLFITGKAGTGKTTLLREIVARLKAKGKYVAVTAPTGVAAHHAEGVTLHSLLHIPLCTYLPGIKIPGLYSLRQEQAEVVRKLDVIIIDEVSMVRCDLMDAIDDILRHYRGNKKPFGGVQMIMIGDLYQLMPVVTDEDQEMLTRPYASFYFFNSKVLESFRYAVIELQKVYRRDQRTFIRLLNRIRRGKLTESGQEKLRRIYHPRYKIGRDDKEIVLTTHNRQAKRLNRQMLTALRGSEREYKAFANGWPRYIEYPAKWILTLKIGARVMLINNHPKGLFYNGMLGKVESLGLDCIEVRTDEDQLICVERMTWHYDCYYLNEKTKELEIRRLGSFSQFPLKLAWAITIHKSQGLTFDHVVIDASKAFAPGQVYVALSRCRTFDNIVLTSKITPDVIMIDPVVTDYLRRVKPIVINEPAAQMEERPVVRKAEAKPGVKRKEEKKRRAKMPKTIKTTWELFEKGCTPEQIAAQRSLTVGTIMGHLSTLIASGKISIHDVMEPSKIRLIEKAITAAHSYQFSLIKGQCPDDISYEDIKMVVSYHQSIFAGL